MAFKKTFVVSDESVNANGFRVKTEGIQLDNAKKNCPAFYDHNTWETPIGHWENLRVENSKLLADLIIEGADEREKLYIRKIENGDLKGASIGADPLAWNSDPLQIAQGQTLPTLEKCVLFELSVTPLPGNQNSLALKHSGDLIVLNSTSKQNFIPQLNQTPDMKAIALKLGLSEAATESDILTAVGALQLNKTSADAFKADVLKGAEEGLTDEQKVIFVELSKNSPATALQFVQLSKTPVVAAVETPAAGGKVIKDVKISDLVQLAKNKAGATEEDAEKSTFDYLQKKNPVELKRIHKEEPAKYATLAKDYSDGVRYNGK